MTPGGGFPLTLELTRDELHRERAAFVDAASGPVGVFDEHLHGANSIGEP